MPTADDYAATVNRYLELLATGGADEITALYTDDATIEDPVGSDVRRGRGAVHEFYAAIENLSKETELVTLRAGRQRDRLLVAHDGECGRQPHQARADQRDDVRRRGEDHVDAGVLVARRRGRSRVALAGGQKTANHIAM